MEALDDRPRSGRPARVTPDIHCELVKLACDRPRNHREDRNTWTQLLAENERLKARLAQKDAVIGAAVEQALETCRPLLARQGHRIRLAVAREGGRAQAPIPRSMREVKREGTYEEVEATVSAGAAPAGCAP